MNEIVTDSVGLRVPTGMPVDGFAFGTGMLLIVTLFGTNDVPTGSESVTEMSVTGIVPSFWNVIVNVIVSPTETMDLSAVFIGLIVLSPNVYRSNCSRCRRSNGYRWFSRIGLVLEGNVTLVLNFSAWWN